MEEISRPPGARGEMERLPRAMTTAPPTSDPQQRFARELDFGQPWIVRSPAPRRMMFRALAAALVLHAIALAAVMQTRRSTPVRMGMGTSRGDGISAWVVPGPRPVGTAGTSPPVERNTRAARTAPAHAPTDVPPPTTGGPTGSGQSGDGGGTAAGGPVRLQAGRGGLEPIAQVKPIYPQAMLAARSTGVVVLDAIIHRDGTVGDITVLTSAGEAFDRAAIDAVKRWRYRPLPYEAIVTVTLSFVLK